MALHALRIPIESYTSINVPIDQTGGKESGRTFLSSNARIFHVLKPPQGSISKHFMSI